MSQLCLSVRSNDFEYCRALVQGFMQDIVEIRLEPCDWKEEQLKELFSCERNVKLMASFVNPTQLNLDDRLRHPGSMGASSWPSRVFKGMRMAGHMGGDRVKVFNLQVIKVIPENNLVIVKGSIPGAKGSYVIVED